MTRLGRLARGVAARLPLPLTEAQFQKQVTDLAEWRGWQWAHFRAARRADGSWYTPFSGPLGEGWPDLVLVRERDRSLIFAEVKSERGRLSAAQTRVLGVLRALASPVEHRTPVGPVQWRSGIEVYVWRPADWDEIERVLA